MLDDALAITECGFKASGMNSYLNTKTNIKKLQYGVDKCFKMHVGKHCNDVICPDLHVDGWKMDSVVDIKTGGVENIEEFSGRHEMKNVEQENYLGDIVSSDGKNHKNMLNRRNRGTGIVTQIMTKLEEVCLGKYFFQVAVIWRSTYLVSSLLTNAEAWYNLIQADIDILESVDEGLLRKILEAPCSTPKEMLYLELGVVPIRYIIKERRLNFLWYILNEDEEAMISMVLKKQLETTVTGDWRDTCKKDLEVLGIGLIMKALEYLNKTKRQASTN